MNAPENSVVSVDRPLSYAGWGGNCEAWTLVLNETLVVKQEMMPTLAAEILHYHKIARQFFYILQGTATFEIDEVTYRLQGGEGIEIAPQQIHRIINSGDTDLQFMVISQPGTENDRFNLV